MDSPRKFHGKLGVALFDRASPFSNDGNWACEYQGSPFAFKSASDLPGDTLWVTNADYGLIGDAGLHRKPNIAHEGFFRTKLSQLGFELGIGELDLEQQARVLADMLGTASAMAKVQLGLTQHPTFGIANAVGQRYGLQEPPAQSRMHQIAKASAQRYTACARDRDLQQGVDRLTFWIPRFDFARSLLSLPLPASDDISEVALHRLPGSGRDALEVACWAEEERLPLFAQISVERLEQKTGKLLNYGSGADTLNAGYDARNMREWCALPELKVLAAAGDIRLERVAIASGWLRSGLNLYETKVSQISHSYGIVAENLWVGLTRSPRNGYGTGASLGSAWIQALDRMHCLRIAEILDAEGFDVFSFGYGRIQVTCAPSVRNLIPTVAQQNNLLYPARLQDLPPPNFDRRSPLDVAQQLLTRHDYSNMSRANALVLQGLEQARKEFA
jgi:hypothetical protein